jgi:Saccharopine dehydrogenase NADP binding domain
MKVLILGGYGNFGARICRALVGNSSIQLLVGGRDLRRAESFAQMLGAPCRGVSVDLRSEDFVHRLREIGPDLIIHTAGPFQQQGYIVARASASMGAHYIDLADGRRFVCDFAENLDEIFRKAGRFAVTGASTVPALSSAVVDHLCAGWSYIESIDTCIAPAQTAPRGRATLAAVLGYCGEPIQVWTKGGWHVRIGWASPTVVRFARLRPRLGALCDIPDLELFPQRYAGVREVMFRAALEVQISQRVFAMLAALRSVRVMPRLDHFAGVLNTLANGLDAFGSSLGGMFVRVRGIDAENRSAEYAWHLAADNDTGPEIPCMAAILLARRLAEGAEIRVGAHPCTGLLKLGDFEPEFRRWNMETDILSEPADHVATTGSVPDDG